MKKLSFVLLATFCLGTFSSCKKCYDCAKQGDLVNICGNNKKELDSDLSIYEGDGYICRKK